MTSRSNFKKWIWRVATKLLNLEIQQALDIPREVCRHPKQNNGWQYKVKIKASCKSSNVIYLITCRRCGQQYVGKTEQLLHCRINNHRYDITHRRTEESHVAEHFNSNADTQAGMVIMVIDQMHSSNPCLQKIRESKWTRTLGTCSILE